MRMIPYVDAGDLPIEVEEYCIEHDFPVHCDSAIVQVPLDESNPLASWLIQQGHSFSPEEFNRGWGTIALQGT